MNLPDASKAAFHPARKSSMAMNTEAAMETMTNSELVETTKVYYDSDDANSFYYHVWGGEDIHIGMYENESDSIFDASRRTVTKMEQLAPNLSKETRVLDIGSGFGGSARFLAKKHQCHVQCLNLSEAQNEVNRKLSKEQGLASQITITTGNFENLPYPADSFDLVWCQDAILHSGQRKRVLEEVYRVLRPGGTFLFTDPMQDEQCNKDKLQPVLARIHLDSLSTVQFYQETSASVGFKACQFYEGSNNLTTHYAKVLIELRQKEIELQDKCSATYMSRMQEGLQLWVDAGLSGDLRWGIFRLHK